MIGAGLQYPILYETLDVGTRFPVLEPPKIVRVHLVVPCTNMQLLNPIPAARPAALRSRVSPSLQVARRSPVFPWARPQSQLAGARPSRPPAAARMQAACAAPGDGSG